ncbi:MAG: glutamate--tRNA ligase [Chitinophagaceae bacterium]|nr:glutamate--tRNA ligase [Chitinophagaceae bacterium]
MPKKPRVRFAPSPTGGLHLGGVRTVLYNYLFAHQQDGQFILRIEDTDQARYVEGAEQYIYDCLAWCRLEPHESPAVGGPYGPYRQSERKSIYGKYAQQLIEQGHAYYAFDTPEELEAMRANFKTEENPSPQYNHIIRKMMRNSLTLPPAEVEQLLKDHTPFVIRINMPENEDISFHDMIRGEVHFNSSQSDDKVLLKADGMPTYHLAVVVDDYLMKITHAFRGEEWLPSAPVHIMLWRYFGWINDMPQWAHLPLILKPDGKGKLSKRDGDRLGFPVFAMDWKDPASGEVTRGFKEMGFLPEAFINMLALLGWNDGTEKELFSKEELIAAFSMDRVHKNGAKFNFEKAKWFNHEWIKRMPDEIIAGKLRAQAKNKLPDEKMTRIASLIKERCTLLTDVWENAWFFFETPADVDVDSIRPRWNSDKRNFFSEWTTEIKETIEWNAMTLESKFKELAASKNIKPGDVLLPLRIMLVGKKIGPGVFDIADIIGKEETIKRVELTLARL